MLGQKKQVLGAWSKKNRVLGQKKTGCLVLGQNTGQNHGCFVKKQVLGQKKTGCAWCLVKKNRVLGAWSKKTGCLVKKTGCLVLGQNTGAWCLVKNAGA
ncbi:MAG: hypothetical protein NTX48_04735 [Planctomycetales bacterium]|nr:hypothetical protein [Planctomycetales bacterium]